MNHPNRSKGNKVIHKVAAYAALLDLAQKVSRSACLQQHIGDRCICFSCEAKAALKLTEAA